MTIVTLPTGARELNLIPAVDAAVRVLSPDYAALNFPARELLHRQAEAMVLATLPCIVDEVCGALAS